MFSNDSISGWIGSSIFIVAQLYQVYHVFNRKRADDVSYPLIFFILIGNAMYTYFGFIDDSLSIFVGNLVTFILILIQLCQKYYYHKYSSNYYENSSNSSLNSYFVDIDEIHTRQHYHN